MPPFNRVVVIVLDSCGVGEAPDAERYGDLGASTLPHVARACGGLRLPVMGRLGLGRIAPIDGVPPDPAAAGGARLLGSQVRLFGRLTC